MPGWSRWARCTPWTSRSGRRRSWTECEIGKPTSPSRRYPTRALVNKADDTFSSRPEASHDSPPSRVERIVPSAQKTFAMLSVTRARWATDSQPGSVSPGRGDHATRLRVEIPLLDRPGACVPRLAAIRRRVLGKLARAVSSSHGDLEPGRRLRPHDGPNGGVEALTPERSSTCGSRRVRNRKAPVLGQLELWSTGLCAAPGSEAKRRLTLARDKAHPADRVQRRRLEILAGITAAGQTNQGRRARRA